MSYATAQELVIAFGARELAQLATPKRFDIVDDAKLELAIEAGNADGDPDEEALEACLDAINQALAVADGIIDSYISVKYKIPLTTTPAALREAALDLARYELMKERATEEAKDRRKDTVAWLRDLAAGKAKLGDATVDAGSSSSGIVIQPSAGRTFNDESLEAFQIGQ